MGFREGLDQMKAAYAEMISGKSMQELVAWCRENGWPNELDGQIDTEYFTILGLVCSKIARVGAPPETIGVYVAGLMAMFEQADPNFRPQEDDHGQREEDGDDGDDPGPH